MPYPRRSVSTSSVWLAAAALALSCFAATMEAGAQELDLVERILGAKGDVQGGALIVRFPRTDVTVAVRDVPLPIALGLVSWTAWKNMGDNTVVMGDLVLLENEVNPVISALEEARISVAALHNHFMGEQPRVMFMHIEGVGKGTVLAEGLRNALSKTTTPKQLGAESPQAPLPLNTKRIEEIMGYSGINAGGAFKISIGRPGVISHGMEMTASMGLNSWSAFMGTDDRTVVAGQVAMTAPEVNRVIRALRNGGIEILAVHNHMLDEQPRIFFLHYWGSGTVEKMAQAVRAAFDEVQGPVR